MEEGKNRGGWLLDAPFLRDLRGTRFQIVSPSPTEEECSMRFGDIGIRQLTRRCSAFRTTVITSEGDIVFGATCFSAL